MSLFECPPVLELWGRIAQEATGSAQENTSKGGDGGEVEKGRRRRNGEKKAEAET